MVHKDSCIIYFMLDIIILHYLVCDLNISEKLLQTLSEDTDVIAKALRKSDTGLVEV